MIESEVLARLLIFYLPFFYLTQSFEKKRLRVEK